MGKTLIGKGEGPGTSTGTRKSEGPVIVDRWGPAFKSYGAAVFAVCKAAPYSREATRWGGIQIFSIFKLIGFEWFLCQSERLTIEY